MLRNETIFCRTVASLLIGLGTLATTGCSTVREHRVDAVTGQVQTVDRHQFFVKSLLGGKKERVTYVQPNGTPVAMQTTAQAPQFAPQQFAPQRAAPQPFSQPSAQMQPAQIQSAATPQRMPQPFVAQPPAAQFPAPGRASW